MWSKLHNLTLALYFQVFWIVAEEYLESCQVSKIPVDTGRKLNVYKTFRRCPGRLLNVLCTFNLRPVSTGSAQKKKLIAATCELNPKTIFEEHISSQNVATYILHAGRR